MSGSIGRRLGKFCLVGFLLGVAVSGALLLASHLTGKMLWDNSYFGQSARIFWPMASIFGMLDVDVGKSVIFTLFAIAIGANGLLYAGLGLIAFFVDRLVERIAESIATHQTYSKRP